MRFLIFGCLAAGLLGTSALGQVSTDSRALDQLGSSKAAPDKPAPHAVRRPRRPAVPPPKKALPAVAMPASPPANPVIQPPPLLMPVHKPSPPPPVPVKADAAGAALPLPNGTRITFAPGGSDLNPVTYESLRAIAARAVATPAMIVSITAWAPGTGDDPSTARRLSLDRALAARAVMINAGLVSDRIRVVAKGFGDIGQGPPDRADVMTGVK